MFAYRVLAEELLTTLIRSIVGQHVQIEYPDTISIPEGLASAWGSRAIGVKTAAGLYDPATRLIKIAVNDPVYRRLPRTALHEAFHAVEDLFLSDIEVAAIDRVVRGRRRLICEYTGFTSRQVSELEGKERRAIAFEADPFSVPMFRNIVSGQMLNRSIRLNKTDAVVS